MKSLPIQMALYLSKDAETHLQRSLHDARGLYAPENIREFEELVCAPLEHKNGDTLRKTSMWPSAAINWLLHDVFGWNNQPYLFVQNNIEGELIWGTYHCNNFR